MTDWLNNPEARTMIWQADAYCYDYHDGDLKALSELQVSQEEVIALCYLRQIHRKVFVEKFTNLTFWSGPHRSGKSLGSVAFGSILDPTFEPRMEQRVIVDTAMLYEELAYIRDNKIFGAYIQLDEVGNTAGSMDYYTDVGKTISKCLQMVGSLRVQISMTAPLKDFALSGIRKMIHTLYSVRRPNNKYSIVSPYNMAPSPISDKVRTPHPRVNLLGMSYVLESFRMTMPPRWLVDRYEGIAGGMKSDMLDGFVESSHKKPEGKKERLDIEMAAMAVAKDYGLYQSFGPRMGKKLSLSLDLIQNHFEMKTPDGITSRQARTIRQKALRIIEETSKTNKEGKA